ncbi:copper amine oxidase N-terminal domain-containing protein [Paenibacillus sp. 2TAB23]|uniref:copper amine oxidase N-terminal domain-containing protein n=1 Tax=Paenibacillus sp. 2TAB23 TaxID=3233004 RepID=UPI003F9CF958
MKMNVMKRMIMLVLPALLVLALLPIAAFAADASIQVEVRLKAGSKTVKINGQATTVEAPFVKAGTTMVPLKVITNAFGAGLKLENGNVITLAYNERKVVLTFGSKTVKVNGAAKTVAVAPVVVKGATMVPLRVIVEAFGAKITTDAKTKETVIIGAKAQSSGTGGSSIDSDYGKTKIGDSYYGWSLNYPTGLVQVAQSDSGDFVSWADTADASKVAAQVNVFTEMIGDDVLTVEEQRDLLYSYYDGDEITVDKRTITVGGQQFEKVVSYTKQSKMYYEYRGVQKADKYFIVLVGVKGSDKSVLGGYDALLNSFVPSFNVSDNTVKNITKVQEGMISFKDADYGFSVKLPAGWYDDSDGSTPAFANKTDSFLFSFGSLLTGDTLESWAARHEKNLREEFVGSNIRNVATAPVNLKNGVALSLSYDISYGEDYWITFNEIAFISGEYRYSLVYLHPSVNSAKSKDTLKQVIASATIDTAYIEKNFGLVDDRLDLIDRSKKITKRSATYGYSIEMPAFWTGEQNNFNEDEVYYTFNAGEFEAYESTDSAEQLASQVNELAYGPQVTTEGITIKENTTVTINGKTARKVVLHAAKPKGMLPYTEILYFFDTADGSMVFYFSLEDVHATESNLKLINDVAQSIRFI